MLTLTYTTYRTTIKALETYEKEMKVVSSCCLLPSLALLPRRQTRTVLCVGSLGSQRNIAAGCRCSNQAQGRARSGTVRARTTVAPTPAFRK